MRSGAAKAGGTGGFLAVLGAGCVFACQYIRAKDPNVDPVLLDAGTAFVMTLGGTVERAFRHRIAYGKWF